MKFIISKGHTNHLPTHWIFFRGIRQFFWGGVKINGPVKVLEGQKPTVDGKMETKKQPNSLKNYRESDNPNHVGLG